MKEIGLVVFIYGSIAGAMIFGAGMWGVFSCQQSSKAMNMNGKFDIITGCMIEPKPGKWVLLKFYRVAE